MRKNAGTGLSGDKAQEAYASSTAEQAYAYVCADHKIDEDIFRHQRDLWCVSEGYGEVAVLNYWSREGHVAFVEG